VGGLALVVDRKKLGPSSSAFHFQVDDQGLPGHSGSGHDFERAPPTAVCLVILEAGDPNGEQIASRVQDANRT